MDCVYSAAEWPIDDLVPDPNQPRKRFEGLEELAATIKANGIIQPIIATPHPDSAGKRKIMIGERRWRAAKIAGCQTVPLLTRNDVPSDRIFFLQLIENLQDYRHPLDAHEKAVALQESVNQMGVEQLCKELGKKKDWISRETALAHVPQEVWALADQEKIADKRTILDLSRLVKHSGKPVEDEWAGIKTIGPSKREALHKRMEASGVKKKRKPKDGADTGEESDDSAAGAGDQTPSSTPAVSVQLVPQRPAGAEATTAHVTTLAMPRNYKRKNLAARVQRASSILGIDADSDFEAFLEELVRRAMPDVFKEEESALT